MERPYNFPPVMPIATMDDFANIQDGNWDPYPLLEDFPSIEVGDILIVGTQMKKKGDDENQHIEEYYMGGTVTAVEGGYIMFKPFDSPLWAAEGRLEEPGELKVDSNFAIRTVPDADIASPQSISPTEDTKIEDCYDEIGDCLELCGEALLSHKDKKLAHAFKIYAKDQLKDGNVDWNPIKWEFLKTWMLRLCRLSIGEWKKIRPADPDKLTTAEKEYFKAEYYDPVSTDMQEKYKNAQFADDLIKNIKGMRTPVNMRYITYMVDTAASDEGPTINASSNEDEAPPEAQVPQDLSVAQDLQTQLDGVRAELATINAQMLLKNAVTEGKGRQPGLIAMKKNGNCLPQAMQLIVDAVAAGGSCDKLVMDEEQENKARAVVLHRAQAHYVRDASDFIALHGMEYPAYYDLHVAKPNTKNYFDEPELMYMVEEYKDVEIRALKTDANGQVRVTSTQREGEAPRKFVGFVDLANVHYDLGAIKEIEQGEIKFVFKHEDADAAQRLLLASKQAGHKFLSKLSKKSPQPETPIAQSKEDFLRHTMAALRGEKKDDSDKSPPAPKATQAQQIDLTQPTMSQQQDRIQNATLVDCLRQELAARDSHFNSKFAQLTSMIQTQQGQQAHAMQAMQATQQQQAMQHHVIQQNQQVPFVHQQPPGQPSPPPSWPAQQVPFGHQQPHLQPSHPPSWPAQKRPSQPAGQNHPGQAWQGNHSMGVVNGLNNSYNQLKSSGVNQWGFSAPQQQQKPISNPKSHPPNRDEAAVVVFGDGDKKKLKELLNDLSPTAYAAMVGAIRPKTGAARYVLTAKAHNVMLVQTLVPLLNARGIRAANYENKRTGQAPRSQAAFDGLQANANSAGICKYYAAQTACPFAQCKYICWQRQ